MSDSEWVEAELEDTTSGKRKKSDKKEKSSKKSKVREDNKQQNEQALEAPPLKEEIKRDEWMSFNDSNNTSNSGGSGGESWLNQLGATGRSNKDKQSEKDKQRERDEELSKKLSKSSGLISSLESLRDTADNSSTVTSTTSSPSSYLVGDGGASWRAKKLLRSKQQANEKGVELDKVLKERFNDTEVKQMESSKYSNYRNNDGNRNKEPIKDYLKNDNDNISQQMRKPSENSKYLWSESNEPSSSRDKYDRDYRRDRNDREYRSDRDRDYRREGDYRSDKNDRDRDYRNDRDRDYRSDRDRDHKSDRRDRDRDYKNDRKEEKEKPRQEEIKVDRTEQPKLSDYIKSSPISSEKPKETTSPPQAPSSSYPTITTTVKSNIVSTPIPTPAKSMNLNKLTGELMKAKLIGDKEKIKKLENQIQEFKSTQSNINSTLEETTSTIKLSGLDQYGRKIFLNEKNTQENAEQQRKQREKEENENLNKMDPKIRDRFDLKKGEKEQSQYYKDDNDFDLNQLVSMEKKQSGTFESSRDMDYDFLQTISKSSNWASDDRDDYGPEFDNSSRSKSISDKKRKENQEKEIKKYKEKIIKSDKHVNSVLEKCWYCQSNNSNKHMIIAMGANCYLQIPSRGQLTIGHCQIIPILHTLSCVETDEDTWDEIQNFKKCLIQMFSKQDRYMVFIETAMKFKQQHHTIIDCIPLPYTLFENAPGYFKKSLIESESEWAPHKLIDTIKKGGLKNSIPKGFPYLWVEFGYKQIGYLHPIDNEMEFQRDFAKTIIMGMLELDLDQVYNKRRSRSEEDLIIKDFKQKFDPFDWTKQLYEK